MTTATGTADRFGLDGAVMERTAERAEVDVEGIDTAEEF